MATLNINLDNVQPTLVSGTNIKTINGVTLLGSTDIALQTVLVSGTSIKTVNGTSILGSGDLTIASGISIGDTIGSGTAGSVLFLGASGVLAQDNSNFFWDDANNRLGIGTATPQVALDVATTGMFGGCVGSSGASDRLQVTGRFTIRAVASGTPQILMQGSGSDAYIDSVTGSMYFRTNGFSQAMLINTSQNVGIGTTSISSKLHVSAASASNTVIIAQGATSQSGNLYENRLVGGTSGISGWDANGNLFSNTGSGIQLATADTQKIGFYGGTPVTRADAMATSISYASIAGTNVRVNDTWGGYTILTAIATLKGLGILP